jgi:hypothetical protein
MLCNKTLPYGFIARLSFKLPLALATVKKTQKCSGFSQIVGLKPGIYAASLSSAKADGNSKELLLPIRASLIAPFLRTACASLKRAVDVP